MGQDLLVTDAFYIKHLQHSIYTLLHGIVYKKLGNAAKSLETAESRL